MALAIIVPTIGRSTLGATLDSIAADITNTDQVVVVTGKENPDVHALVDEFSTLHDGEWIYGWPFETVNENVGHGLRNVALDEIITASHVCSIDDDDQYYPGALSLLRAAACDKPVIFKTRWGAAHPANGVELWQERRVCLGNIATPMIVAPVCAARFTPPQEPLSDLERWTIAQQGDPWYFADLGWAQQLVAELGAPVWREEFVALIRPVEP